MSKKSSKYVKRLENYIQWIPKESDLFKQEFIFSENGSSAYDIMLDWESNGVQLPKYTSQPELLSKYVQGKKSRDFHIKEWKQAVKSLYFKSEEFKDSLGCKDNEKEFRNIFNQC